MKAKGWIAADTEALSAAIAALSDASGSQKTAQAERVGATSARNAAANHLYEALLTIQNAATLQWPEREPANVAVRAEFRLGLFPPRPARSASANGSGRNGQRNGEQSREVPSLAVGVN